MGGIKGDYSLGWLGPVAQLLQKFWASTPAACHLADVSDPLDTCFTHLIYSDPSHTSDPPYICTTQWVPVPIPSKTHTQRPGMGSYRVRVWVAPKNPRVLSSPLENKVFKPFFQLANHGKISMILLQLCECFCVIHIIAYKPPTTTTRQNHGNISIISLQPWECFHKLHWAYTTT